MLVVIVVLRAFSETSLQSECYNTLGRAQELLNGIPTPEPFLGLMPKTHGGARAF
jgi:hypothetical protein